MLTGLVKTSDQWPRVAMAAMAEDLAFWAKQPWKETDHERLFYTEGLDFSDDEGPFEIAESDDSVAVRTIVPAGSTKTGYEVLKIDIFQTFIDGTMDEAYTVGRHYEIQSDWWSI